MRRADIERRIDSLCEWLDMGSFVDRRAAGFSQGERMKVSIARATFMTHSTSFSMNPRAVSMWEAPVRCDNSSVRSAGAMHHPVESRHAGGFRSVRRHRGGGPSRVVATGSPDALREQAGLESLEDAFVRLTQLEEKTESSLEEAAS